MYSFGRNNKRTLDRFARHRTCPGIEPGLIPHRHNPKTAKQFGHNSLRTNRLAKVVRPHKVERVPKNSPRQKWFALLDMIGHSSPVSTSNKRFGSFGLTCPLCVRLQKSFCRGQLCNIQPQRDNNPHRRAQTRKARTGIHEYASAGLFCLSAKGILRHGRESNPAHTPIVHAYLAASNLALRASYFARSRSSFAAVAAALSAAFLAATWAASSFLRAALNIA